LRSTEYRTTLRDAIQCLQSYVAEHRETAAQGASIEMALLWRSIDSLVLRLIACEHAGRLRAGMLSAADMWALDELARVLPRRLDLLHWLRQQIGAAIGDSSRSSEGEGDQEAPA
jgi:hypothetical protein